MERNVTRSKKSNSNSIEQYRINSFIQSGYKNFHFARSFEQSKLFSSGPEINYFTPGKGPIGTVVTIYGMNFSPNATDNSVFFGAVRSNVLSVNTSGTELKVTVPLSATFQPISVTSNNLTSFSTQSFDVTFICGGRDFSSESFAPKVDYVTTSAPFGISIADMDGNGKPDLVVSNGSDASSNTISIFENKSASGSFIFGPKMDYTTAKGPWGIAVGDFNMDSKYDVVTANIGSSTASVLLNTSSTGNISLGLKNDLTANSQAAGVAVGDIDGDGKPDIAVANEISMLSIFRNTTTNGTVSFAPKSDFSTNGATYSVAINDLDGDAKADLVTANYNTSTISVFRNNSTAGSIILNSKIDYQTGGGSYYLTVGDLNGDEKLDLIVTNASSSTVSVFKNTSSIGSISFASKVDFLTGTTPAFVDIGDLDGDGKPDLAIANFDAKTISVLRNMSTGSDILLAPNVDFNVGASPNEVTIGDLDGDEKPDLAVTNRDGKSISLLRNQIVPIIPQLSPEGTTEICPGGKQLLTATGGTSYQWALNGTPINGATAETYSATQPGNYSVVITNGPCSGPASNTATITTAAAPTGNIAPQSASVCPGGKQLLTATGGTSYQWALNGTPIAGATAETYSATQPGNYSVVITNGSCSGPASNTVTITTAAAPTGNIAPQSAAICTGGKQLLTATGGTSYQWALNGTPITGATAETYSATQPGNYSVVITNGSCSGPASNTATITTADAPTGIKYPTFYVTSNKPTLLSTRNLDGEYLWSPTEGLDNPKSKTPIITTKQDRLYYIRITSSLGCIIIDTLRIEVFKESKVFVPTGFTPNNDGLNEVLRPFLVNIPTINYFRIYNRWGQIIFETNKPNIGWNGELKGISQPTGGYVWLFEGKDGEGNTINAKGSFTLIR